MSLQVYITSDLPYHDDYPYVQGNLAIPIQIVVYNEDEVNSVQLKQIYLTENDSALGTGAALSLGMPVFKYISSQNPTTNNVIPPDSEVIYDVLYIPQINALQAPIVAEATPTAQLGKNRYSVELRAIVQVYGSTEMYRGEIAKFYVYPAANVSYNIVTPVKVWSLYDNQRPTNNDNFDFQIMVEEILENGNIVSVPQDQLYFTTSAPSILQVIGEGVNGATEGENSKIIGGAGCCVVGTYSPTVQAEISVRRWGYTFPIIGSVKIAVVNALPVSLAISPPLLNFTRDPASVNRVNYAARLTKSNGSVEDVSNSEDIVWLANGQESSAVGYFIPGASINRGRLYVEDDYNQLNPYSAVPAVITATYSPGYNTLTGQANIFVRKTV